MNETYEQKRQLAARDAALTVTSTLHVSPAVASAVAGDIGQRVLRAIDRLTPDDHVDHEVLQEMGVEPKPVRGGHVATDPLLEAVDMVLWHAKTIPTDSVGRQRLAAEIVEALAQLVVWGPDAEKPTESNHEGRRPLGWNGTRPTERELAQPKNWVDPRPDLNRLGIVPKDGFSLPDEFTGTIPMTTEEKYELGPDGRRANAPMEVTLTRLKNNTVLGTALENAKAGEKIQVVLNDAGIEYFMRRTD